MTEFKSDLLRLLESRGYIHQVTDPDGLDTLAAKQIVPGYIGFDATAPSLHVGNLVQIMMLRRLQQAGHKPIVVMGGGTTKIGDPSGKDEGRKMLSHQDIEGNIASIRRIFEHFLTFGDGPSDAIMVNNDDWLSALEYIPFLRDIGPHFTINRMLTFDSVRLRLEREQPLTFLEFNYMILQAYDFLELSRRVECRLQLGGSDQWGNIVNGVELCRRVDGTQVYGLTSPLITTASGAKMGKTAAGAVWLNGSFIDYWQFWRNTHDDDVGRFLRLFTDLSLQEISELEALQGAEINHAKKRLATEATKLIFGEASARDAELDAEAVFEKGTFSPDRPMLTIKSRYMRLIDACLRAQLVSSKGEFRRHVQGGAIRVNEEKISDPEYILDVGALGQTGTFKLSVGRKKHAVVMLHALDKHLSSFPELYD